MGALGSGPRLEGSTETEEAIRFMSRKHLLAAAIVVIYSALPSRAAADRLFVELFDSKGTLIEGPVELKGYAGSVDGLTFLFKWLVEVDPVTGQHTGAPRPSKLEITIPVGAHTPRLAALHSKGAPLKQVVFHFAADTGRGAFADFYEITIDDVHITRHSLSLPDATDAANRGKNENETLELVYGGLEQGGFRVEQLRYFPGDTNGDLKVDISDPILLLGYLFLGATVRCPLSGDVNGDAKLDISDAVAELNFLFSGGRPPPAPFPQCGTRPTDIPIPCEISACDAE